MYRFPTYGAPLSALCERFIFAAGLFNPSLQPVAPKPNFAKMEVAPYPTILPLLLCADELTFLWDGHARSCYLVHDVRTTLPGR